MCNIAGYVGTRAAAPILIEMMRKQEGLDAGFYTGIATIHEGKIYCAKVVGTVDDLISNTDALNLPGTIGIIHSRTPGGKNQCNEEWAHPFTTIRDGEIETAYIANGCIRFFNPWLEKRIAIAESLHNDGYEIKAKVYSPTSSYKLSNGMTMHGSDVMCQLITRNIDHGVNAVDAMANAFCENPGEIVGLLLSKTEPDGIAWARMNFPMHVNFVEHGAYLATTPMAFPEDAGEPQLLHPFSSGMIYKDHLTIKPFKNPPAEIWPMDSILFHKMYEVIYAELKKEGGTTVPELGKLITPMFGEGKLAPIGAVIYRILYDINRIEPLKFETKYKPGQTENLKAPVFYMSL